jgi:LuxR family maltose regulon positive regulatory protein
MKRKRQDPHADNGGEEKKDILGTFFRFPKELLSSQLSRKICVRDGIRATLLIAPAGYGKTLALRQLRAANETRQRSSIWLDLDESDREPRSFLYRLVSSFKSRTSAIKGARGKISSDDIATIATALDNHAPVTIFLDRCEAIVGSPSECVLRELIDRTGDNVAFAIAGRSPPKINIGALKAQGLAEEIGANRLRLTDAEATEILEAMPHLLLDEKQKRTIVDVAEGWAAGLGLIASCLHLNPEALADTSSSIGEWFSVGEYFQEVLAREPKEIQLFLMQASILDCLNVDLCDEMIDESGTYETIEYCSDRGLFLFPDKIDHSSFRLHKLFQEFLRLRYSRTLPEEKRALHKRAAEIYIGRECFEPAFDHAIQARDFTNAATILDKFCLENAGEGADWRIVVLGRKLPAATRNLFPRITLAMAWPLIFRWEFDEAEETLHSCRLRLDEIVQSGDMPAHEIRDLENLILHREMMLGLFRNDAARAEKLCCGLIDGYTEARPLVKASLFITLLQIHRDTYNLRDADALAARAKKLLDRSVHPRAIIPLDAAVADVRLMRGMDDDYVDYLSHTLKEYARFASHDPLLSMIALPLAAIHYERDERQRARSLVDEYLRTTPEAGFLEGWTAGVQVRAGLLNLQGDMKGALDLLDSSAAWLPTGSLDRARMFFTSDKIQLLLNRGLSKDALFVAERAGFTCSASEVLPREGRATVWDEARALSWARLARAGERFSDGLRVATQWRSFVVNAGAIRSAVRWDAVAATLLFADGQVRAAQRQLRRAITAAGPWMYLRSILDEGPLIGELLLGQPEIAGDEDERIRKFGNMLIAQFGRSIDGHSVLLPTDSVEDEQPPSNVVLNAREMDLIRMVVAGLSNREIGMRAGMTEGSVKWYLHQIYEKMGVKRRTLAARRARELGLVT